MSQQQDGTARMATWLGIAGALVGLLAFFGITSYDDLKHAVQGPDATASPRDGNDKGACQIAEKAYSDYANNLTQRQALAARTYAHALSLAAGQAATSALATAMRTNVASLEVYAQAHDRGASYYERLDLATQHHNDTEAWERLCSQS